MTTPIQILKRLQDRDEFIRFCVSKEPEIVAYNPEAFESVTNPTGVVETVCKALASTTKTVVYPMDVKIVPRIPLTKQPLFKWRELALKPANDPTVLDIKHIASRLGPRVNHGFVLDGFLLVDVDGVNGIEQELFDIATKRGFHKLFKLTSGYRAARINSGFSTLIECEKARVELKSGPFYLGSYPEMNWFLVLEGGKIKVKKYRCVSKECRKAVAMADFSVFEADAETVTKYLKELDVVLGCGGKLAALEITLVHEVQLQSPNPKKSRFNESTRRQVALLAYREVRRLLERKRDLLPACLRHALFEEIPKGYRWFHLRLLAYVLPSLASLSDADVDELIDDFAARGRSTAGERRKWEYDFKYFTGRLKIDGEEEFTPSVYGPPLEAWQAFHELGYCKTCPLAKQCLHTSPGKRKRLIVEYIQQLLESGGER